MKTIFIAIAFLLIAGTLQAQIGVGTTTPNSSLEVFGSMAARVRTFTSAYTADITDYNLIFTGTSATTVTLPTAVGISGRMYTIKNASTNSSVLTVATTSAQTIDGTTSQVLSNPYQTISVVSNGTQWNIVGYAIPSGNYWALGGNAVAGVTSLGTTSNYALPLITNNIERMRITATGSVGIGTSSFNGTYPEKLIVDAGAPATPGNYQNVIIGKGNTNSYAQLNIQNIYSAANNSASSDVVATSDNGNESINFIDMGINSGTNSTTGVLGGANKAYLYSTGNDFAIGNGTNSKSLNFFTTAAGIYTERMRVEANGNVGIGTSSPTAALHVVKSNSGGNVINIQNTMYLVTAAQIFTVIQEHYQELLVMETQALVVSLQDVVTLICMEMILYLEMEVLHLFL